MKLRVLIADDESVALKRLRRLVEALPDVEVVAECVDGQSVLDALREGAVVDVAILDIRMPGLSGLDARALMPEDGPFVIFATAHEDYAVDAFAVGATDYVLKPLSAARLTKALERARAHVEMRGGRHQAPLGKLPVTTKKGVVLLAPADISHATLESDLVTVHTADGSYVTDFTLSELESRLGGGVFRRVHRQAILNLDYVEVLELQSSGGYLARTTEGALIPVSRQAARALRKELGLS